MPTNETGKQALRRSVLSKRNQLSATDLAEASEAIRRRIREAEVFQAARRIHCFASLPNEVQTDGIIADCWADGKEVYLPFQIPEHNRLGMAQYLLGDELVTGPFGVPEPTFERRKTQPPLENVDLIFVPGVAFDRKGFRVGYGKGYYDKFLLEAGYGQRQHLFIIGIALQMQIISEIPKESWDIPVGAIFTETNYFRTNGE